MIAFLRVFFSMIFVAMIYITLKAGSQENMFSAIHHLSNEPWAVATLWDAYCGFFTFYVWVFYKESWVGRTIWFILIMTLGNIAMSAYALYQLFRTPLTGSFSDVVLKRGRS